MKKIICVFAAILTFFTIQFFPSCKVFAATGKTIKVGISEIEGLSEKSADGKRTGLIIDFLDEISNYTGWKYDYIDIDGNDLTGEFFAGKFDLVGGFYYLDAIKDICGFPDYNIGYSKSVLLARNDDVSAQGYDLRTLNGKVIGVYNRAVENVRRLKEYLSINGVSCTIKEYTYDDLNENGKLFDFLDNGEVDMILGNTADANKGYRVITVFNSQPYYIVTQPGDKGLLAELNSALVKIYQSNPNFAEERYNENFENLISADITFNDEEKSFINSSTFVKVAVFPLKPLFIVNADGTFSGIVPDILNIISEKSGLKFKYVVTQTYISAIEKLISGEADFLGIFPDDKETAKNKGLTLTNDFVTVNCSLVRNKKVSYPSDNLTIGVLNGRGVPGEIIAAKTVAFDSVKDALKAVDRGEIDLVYGLSAQMEKDIQEQHFANIVSLALNDNREAVHFAIVKPAVVPLFTILNKSINMISDETTASIVSKHTEAVGSLSYNLLDFIYTNPIMFLIIICSIILLIIAVVVIIIFYRVRSEKMNLALEKSNANAAAKSDFLSRMSHEIRTPMNAVVGLADLTSRQENVPETIKKNLVKINLSAHYLLKLLNDILDMSRLDNGMLTIAKDPFSVKQMADELGSMMSSESERYGIRFSIESVLFNDQYSGDAIRLRQVLTNLVSNAFKFTPAGGSVTLNIIETVGEKESELYFSVKDTGIGVAKEDQDRIFKSFEQANTNYTKSQGTGLGLAISRNIVQLMDGELKLKSELGAGSEFYFSVKLPHATVVEKKYAVDETLLKDVRILMAEDNDLNAEIARDILEMVGAKIVRAKNGKDAVAMFAENALQFDLILMDIHMPLMNGLEATKLIRNLGIPNADIVPIIAMTANSFQEDADEAIHAGMNDFVTKPIDIDFLYSVLLRNIKK